MSNHFDVIAQGLVTFSNETHQWALDGRDVAGTSLDFALGTPAFVFSDGGTALVSVSGTPAWRLGDGEAAFVAGSASLAAIGEAGQTTRLTDSDDDGLSDGEEFNVHSTDPENPDSDNDGLTDKQEVDGGTDPNVPN